MGFDLYWVVCFHQHATLTLDPLGRLSAAALDPLCTRLVLGVQSLITQVLRLLRELNRADSVPCGHTLNNKHSFRCNYKRLPVQIWFQT